MIDVELSEVLAELDVVGQALFDAATRRAIDRKTATALAEMQKRVEELEKPPEAVAAE